MNFTPQFKKKLKPLFQIFFLQKQQQTVKCTVECSLVNGPRVSSRWLVRQPPTVTHKPFHRDHRADGDHTRWPVRSPPPQSCSCSPLLLGHREWLLHLDDAAIVDHDVFQRLISSVRLRAFDLLHHVLEDEKERGRSHQNSLYSKMLGFF